MDTIDIINHFLNITANKGFYIQEIIDALKMHVKIDKQINRDNKTAYKINKTIVNDYLNEFLEKKLIFKTCDKYYVSNQFKRNTIPNNFIDLQWTYDDSLILMGIFASKSKNEIKIRDILFWVDYIDRIVPSCITLHETLNRLSSAKLIKSMNGKLFMTSKAMKLFDNIKNYKTAREQLKNLFGLLNCPNCGVKLKEIKWNEIISKKIWDEEYNKYQNSFSR